VLQEIVGVVHRHQPTPGAHRLFREAIQMKNPGLVREVSRDGIPQLVEPFWVAKNLCAPRTSNVASFNRHHESQHVRNAGP
jgi:hypothetical protein